MEGESPDMIPDQLKKLKQLFPETVTEGKIDCIIIDPPYNTGNDQLKTNMALQMRDTEIDFKRCK